MGNQIQIDQPSQLACERSLSVQMYGDLHMFVNAVGHQSNTYTASSARTTHWVNHSPLPAISASCSPGSVFVSWAMLRKWQALWWCLLDKAVAFLEAKTVTRDLEQYLHTFPACWQPACGRKQKILTPWSDPRMNHLFYSPMQPAMVS